MNPDGVIILRWLKPDGAMVQKGDVICVIRTPRKTVKYAAENTGVLRHGVPAGNEQSSKFTLCSIKPVRPPSRRKTPVTTPVDIEQLEKLAITKALGECEGNQTDAAKGLGISVRTLERKLRQHKL